MRSLPPIITMKTVRFIRSVLVDGSHCERGTTADVPAKIAAFLIANGSAIAAEKPASIETAEAQRAEVETATIPTPKVRGRK